MERRGFGPDGEAAIRVETVVSGLEVPWGLAFLPDDGGILVTERPGRIRLVREGAVVEEPVATVPIAKASEGGLLGIALHPDFRENRTFFVYATQDSDFGTVNRVLRYVLTESGSARFDGIHLDGIPSATYHDGGRLRIGPDGMLYVGTSGDGQNRP